MKLSDAAEPTPQAEPTPGSQYGIVVTLILGYIGVYLCRMNFSVANPLMQTAFHVGKQQVGWIATISTIAYVLGKLAGPLVDRLGGRRGFLLSLLGVCIFGAAGGVAPGLVTLTVCYSLNRFCGASGWGAMMKIVPTWFRPARMATVVAIISLSYVLGAWAARQLASQVVQHGGSWRAVMGLPSLVLAAILGLCFLVVRGGPLRYAPAPAEACDRPVREAGKPPLADLMRRPQFIVLCVMSFTLTLLRESFNNWSVDFLASVEKGSGAVAAAALKSTTFDLAGGASILLMGFAYDRVPPPLRRWLIAGILSLLTAVLLSLQPMVVAHPERGAALVGLVGLLVYGPYSLLAGVLAVEAAGAELAATACGIVDAVGYLAGALAGALLGRILDVGGYHLGFCCLAGVTAFSALLSLAMRPSPRQG